MWSEAMPSTIFSITLSIIKTSPINDEPSLTIVAPGNNFLITIHNHIITDFCKITLNKKINV